MARRVLRDGKDGVHLSIVCQVKELTDLDRLAAHQGRTRSELVREGIKLVVARYTKNLNGKEVLPHEHTPKPGAAAEVNYGG